MCRALVCFMLSSLSAFGFLYNSLFSFCLLLALLLSCLLLAVFLSCLLLALLLSCLLLALLFWFFHHFSSAHSDSVLRISSPIFHLLSATSCCVRQSGVAGFLLLVATGAVGRGSLSVLCLNSLTAHRDLSHLCVARRLLRVARSCSVTLWQFTTPWFVSGFSQHNYSALRHFVIVVSR